jgi:hypothetical protein
MTKRRFKYSIEDASEIAIARGGNCLSTEFTGCKNNLLWACYEGHKWEATLDNIKNKMSWCPRCKVSFSEEICRVYFETIFDKKFPTIRPKWLLNYKTNKSLELDGYCEELNIAFEHNGACHFGDAYFSDNDAKVKDPFKIEMCDKYNVKLFVIDELFKKTKYNDLLNVIKVQAEKLKIELRPDIDELSFNISNIYDKTSLIKYEQLAVKKGGKLIKETYVNADTRCKWECKEGHVWQAFPYSIKAGTWCPDCAIVNRGPRIIKIKQEIFDFATLKGGKCLSVNFGNKSKLKWICSNNHTWDESYTMAKKQWCVQCNYLDKTDYYNNIIDEICNLKKYKRVSVYTKKEGKINFECQNGHKWSASYGLFKKVGCKECNKIERTKILD